MSLFKAALLFICIIGISWFCCYIWRIAGLPICPNCWKSDCEKSATEGFVRCKKCGWEFLKGKAEL